LTTFTHHPQLSIEFRTKAGEIFITTQAYHYVSTRTLDNPVATAEIFLKGRTFEGTNNPRVDGQLIRNVIRSNDLAKIRISDGAGNSNIDVSGLAKVVGEHEMEIGGKPDHRVSLSVQGKGQELINYQIFWHPHIASRNNLGGIGFLVRSKGKPISGRPDEVLRGLIGAFFNDKYVFQFADGKVIGDAFSLNFEAPLESMGTTALSALGMEGPLWETLKRYSDAPWHELFVDIQHEKTGLQELDFAGQSLASYEDKVGLYFRPTPWDFDTWDALRGQYGWGFTFDDEERIDDGTELSRDESRINNFFWVPAKAPYSGFDQLSMAFNQSNGKLPIYDEHSIANHGLRRMEQATEYVQYVTLADETHGSLTAEQRQRGATKQIAIQDLLALRTLQLYRWFGYEEFYDGTITTRGRIGASPEHGARVGSILTRKRDNWQFYVTGIMQIWEYPGTHSTRWTVARGRDQVHYRRWWADIQKRRASSTPKQPEIPAPIGGTGF